MELENEIYSYDSGIIHLDLELRLEEKNRNVDSGLKPKVVKAAKGTAK